MDRFRNMFTLLLLWNKISKNTQMIASNKTTFGERIIMHREPVAWPLRSCYNVANDGYMKSQSKVVKNWTLAEIYSC